MIRNLSKKIPLTLCSLMRDKGANFGILAALTVPILLVAAGGAVDFSIGISEKTRLQGELDAAILAAAKETDETAQRSLAESYMTDLAVSETERKALEAAGTTLALKRNADGSLTGNYKKAHPTYILGIVGIKEIPLGVTATAITSGTSAGNGCIYVLGNQNQAVLINSGANLTSTACAVNVHSTASPAFIMNSGSKIATAKFCVKGTQYIKNGGTLTNLETGCTPAADPHAGKLAEPSIPGNCMTQGTMDGQTISLKPGMHCGTTFNGSPTVTFQPGLHIIKGRMILNSGATVVAEGVTFYFPDVDSELRANGGLTLTATAPTTVPTAGILMFEKTSDTGNNANKRQYVFNGSNGETLKGIIHLPNRDVTYNSTTNQNSEISLVVNSMIINSANWQVEPYKGIESANGVASVRLVQ